LFEQLVHIIAAFTMLFRILDELLDSLFVFQTFFDMMLQQLSLADLPFDFDHWLSLHM
jgi:hypothetical protein